VVGARRLASAQLLDQPLKLYSTDIAAEVAANLKDVRAAGIDAVIVSYQGSDVGGGWNLRRLRYVLDGAQQAGLKVTVHLETLAANRVGPGRRAARSRRAHAGSSSWSTRWPRTRPG
jgi:hypothetical protein